MASDSTWSDGDERGAMRKVWRRHSSLIGLAGSVAQIQSWLDEDRAGVLRHGQRHLEHVIALRMTASGLSMWTNHDGWLDMPSQWAIGTGGKAARAAMACGVGVRRAVKIAIEIDAGSHGSTRSYKL